MSEYCRGSKQGTQQDMHRLVVRDPYLCWAVMRERFLFPSVLVNALLNR